MAIKLTKKWAYAGIFTLMLILLSVLMYIFLSNDSSQKEAVAPEQKEISIIEGAGAPEFVVEFDKIIEQFNSNSFNESLVNSKNYADNPTKDSVSRLNMYLICIKSGQVLTDDATVSNCFEKGKELAITLNETDALQWESILTAAFNKQDQAEVTDGPS